MKPLQKKPTRSPLFNLLLSTFPAIPNPERIGTLIPIHRMGTLTTPHPDYPCFGRAMISAPVPRENYNAHQIFRSAALASPWFASVVRIPGDTFNYAPLANALAGRRATLIDMVFICVEGMWFFHLQRDTYEGIIRKLKNMEVPPLTNPKPAPGGQYFEPALH